MTNKTKATAAAAKPEAAEGDVPEAERIDMNDPSLSDAEAVARNLGVDPAEQAADDSDKA